MQTVINGLTISGTPIEMAELAKLFTAQVEKPKQATKAEPKQAPSKSAKKTLDMGKVKALRKAGWTLEKIADEMGCSAQTIANKLKGAE
jgi:hypothetical protein